MSPQYYDLIVIGAGHAGCEAAAAAANLGSKTLLVTMDMTKMAQMSCNPAMGGIAKGQLVREIDALGGYSGIITDKTMIQFRMLNRSKGPAMWSPRAQCDRVLFSIEWRKILENLQHLDFWQDNVESLIIENQKVKGIKTHLGIEFFAQTVILTAGTFLNGLIHVGKSQTVGGRISEPASTGITEQLKSLGMETDRMKTGTPARIDGRTIDFSKLIKQEGDFPIEKFSYLPHINEFLPQQSCWITYTNENVHNILKTGFNESPLFNGTIKSIGPRYCPSIETKLVTFSDKDKHQLFIEPEGLTTNEYYLNGFSSSLPLEVQYQAIRNINGLENAKIYRPGYAIEYDFFQPTQLFPTLESKIIENLYFAGQVNGTTGYEEAAAQGLMAGINAHRKIFSNKNFILARDEAYIGVLIDDLITKGVDEPYRMFTSRAEYRILLRQDNADFRLTQKSFEIGLANSERKNILQFKQNAIKEFVDFANQFLVKADEINPFLETFNSSLLQHSVKLSQLILRPELSLNSFLHFLKPYEKIAKESPINISEIIEAVEIEIKYKGYIEREQIIAEKLRRLEHIEIRENMDYERIHSLSTEGRQKLSKIRPQTIGQASRISGVSPSDINILLIYLGK